MGLYRVKSFVEKPKPEDAPSDLAIIGRYLLTPEIFEELENTQPGKGNEIQLTDAIDSLNNRQHVYAHEFKGSRYDIGSKIGFLETNIEFGLKHPQTKDQLRAYIKELAAKL
jgi:UTP--glucose-1-phosphate uridylyltransferase